jgi:hypothetical protein
MSKVMLSKRSLLFTILFSTLILTNSFSQAEEVEIVIGDSIQVIKEHTPPFVPASVVISESFTIPDPVDAAIDSIRVKEDGSALLAYIKLKLDDSAIAGQSYTKIVTLIYIQGQATASFPHEFSVLAKGMATPTNDMDGATNARLGQNFPNPFTESTIIPYSLSESGHVWIVVYDQLGRAVKTLVDERKPAGDFQVFFDGAALIAGTYVCRMYTQGGVVTKRLVVSN